MLCTLNCLSGPREWKKQLTFPMPPWADQAFLACSCGFICECAIENKNILDHTTPEFTKLVMFCQNAGRERGSAIFRDLLTTPKMDVFFLPLWGFGCEMWEIHLAALYRVNSKSLDFNFSFTLIFLPLYGIVTKFLCLCKQMKDKLERRRPVSSLSV